MTCNQCIHHRMCNVHGYADADDCSLFENKADFVEVVRCKDCKHWSNGDCYRLELSRPDDFCSYGERK